MIIPIANALPRAYKTRKTNKMIQIIITPIIWLVVTYFFYIYIMEKFPAFASAINVGLVVGFIQISVKSARGGADLDADLKDRYGL